MTALQRIWNDAPLATVEQLSRAHPREHVEEILASVPESGIRHLYHADRTARIEGMLEADALRGSAHGNPIGQLGNGRDACDPRQLGQDVLGQALASLSCAHLEDVVEIFGDSANLQC